MRDRDATDQWKLGGVEVPRKVQEFRVTLDCEILAVANPSEIHAEGFTSSQCSRSKPVLDPGQFYTTTSHAGPPTECMLAIFLYAVLLFAANSGQPDAQSTQARTFADTAAFIGLVQMVNE